MNPIPNLKRFMLRALKTADGNPMPEHALERAVFDTAFPKPLLSDVKQARRELETDGFITGQRDTLDAESSTWTLTEKGRHQAALL